MRRFLVFPILLLAGCTPVVNLEAAQFSNDPGCAEVSVRLPSEIGDALRRETNSQATAAWGEPSSILLRCGLEPVEVSPLPCVSAAGVDWLVDETNAPNYRFISFARTPAVEVIVDSEAASGISALEAVASAVGQLPASAACTEVTN